MVKTATESMEKNTKKRELEAKIKIDVCISGMQFKIKQAESINMCYAKINDIDVASWKLINCLVENKVVTGIDPSLEHKKKRLNQEQGDGVKTLTNIDRLILNTINKVELKSYRIFDCQDNHYEADDFKLAFGGKGQRKKKSVIDANKNIKKCMDELETKMKSSIDKNIYFAKVSGIDVVSWKIIDCLVEDEIVDERVQIAKPKKFWKENQGSPGCHSPRNSKRTQGSHEKHRRSKSLPRFHQREIHGHAGSPREKRTLYFNDDEDVDGFNVDAFINPSTYTAGTGAQSETYYKCLNSVLEKQKKIGLKKEFLRKTDVCAECEKKEQHVKRYRAERDELKLDKKRLETVMVGLSRERNDAISKLQIIDDENSEKFESLKRQIAREKNETSTKLQIKAVKNIELVNKIENLERQILNAESDDTYSLKTRSLEKTIENLKKTIVEMQISEKQWQNALKESKQTTEYQKSLLQRYREEKNTVEINLSDHQIETDQLQCEKDHLQKSNENLKNLKQHAEEQIISLKKEMKKKDEDFNNLKKQLMEKNKDINDLKKELKETNKELQQSKQFNEELSEVLEKTERKNQELPSREQNQFIQQQENNRILAEKNESLKTKIYEMERKQGDVQKEHIDIEHKFEGKISHLKIQNKESEERIIDLKRELEEMKSKNREQQSILDLERCQLKEIKKLRMQFDDQQRSRSTNSPRANIYRMDEGGFMDINELKRSTASLQGKYTAGGGKSDFEKENISLKSELSEALDNIEELRTLSERYESEKVVDKRTIADLQWEKGSLENEMVSWKAKMEQIQSDLKNLKHEHVHQQDSSYGKLCQDNRKLEKDKELLRKKIFLLENEKVKLEKRMQKSSEENMSLQREKNNLQHNLGEKSDQLQKLESRSIKLDTDLTHLQNMRTENEDLKASLEEVKRELDNLEKRYKKETADRMSSDNASTKINDENERLRKERNSARIELQKLLREKKDSYQNQNTEQVLAREELQNKEREKLELVALFKDKEEKDLQKIQLYEKEIETLKSKCREDNDKMRQSEHDVKTLNSRYRDDQDKIQRLEHEVYTLKSSCTDENVQVQRMEHEIETSKSRHRDDNDKIQRMKLEIETLKSKHRDDNNKMRQMEHEIETLKSRLTGEKANQYSSYEMLQNKNDLEACKHQKKALEDERNELQKENMELENELQSLNSKLEQIDDSEKNISNLKKHIKDLEEGYRNAVSDVQTLTESVEDQKQENRDLIVKLENLDMEKKDLENKLRVMFSKDETSKLQKDNTELKHNLQNLSKQLKESENRLALNKSSLGNRCEELQNILQDKEQEINNLKLRFQELVDSKETSEVLQNRIINLQQEKSELNQRLQELEVLKRQVHKLGSENLELNKRLEISSKEKSSIHKENKELKNILQEKLSEVKRLEERCRHLQTLERDVQKLKRENKELDTEVVSQRQNNETLNNRLEILNVEKLEIEDRLRRRSPQVVSESKSCQNCFKHRNDISDLKREINDLRDRLSEAAGNKLRDNNPNIADLSDMNRPTSLAEKFSSLYTDEYTDAMEVIEDDMDEAASVKVMLDLLKRCYDWCQRLAKEQRDTLINRSIGFMENHGGQNVVLSDRCLIFVKEFQKKIAVESLEVVGQICHVKSVTQQTLSSEKYIVKYIKKCSELCWMMQISDPPLYVNFDVNSGENLNKNDYNVFTKSGSKIDYLVWPVLYLHKTGPMLAKGVAQGK